MATRIGDHGTILALDGHAFDRVQVWAEVFVYEHDCEGVTYVLAEGEHGGWHWSARLDPQVFDGSVKFQSPLSEPAPLHPLDAFTAARRAVEEGTR